MTNLFAYTFWIRKLELRDNYPQYTDSAEAVSVSGSDYCDAFLKFIQKYAALFEVSVNGLSNREKTIDLGGKTVTINCQKIKFINQIEIINGTIILIPSFDCYLLRANLNSIQIVVQPKENGRLIVSNSRCKEVVFKGDNVYFDGPVEGQYLALDSHGNERTATPGHVKEHKRREAANEDMKPKGREKTDNKKVSIPAEVYQRLSNVLGTKDIRTILDAYNKDQS